MTRTKNRMVGAKAAILSLAAAGLFVGVTAAHDAAHAGRITDRLKVACSADYDRFCPGYKVGGSKLRSCMRAKGKRLSRVCVEALVDAGWVSRRVLKKFR